MLLSHFADPVEHPSSSRPVGVHPVPMRVLGGLGEPCVPPIAPAVTKPYRCDGIRVRYLPSRIRRLSRRANRYLAAQNSGNLSSPSSPPSSFLADGVTAAPDSRRTWTYLPVNPKPP